MLFGRNSTAFLSLNRSRLKNKRSTRLPRRLRRSSVRQFWTHSKTMTRLSTSPPFAFHLSKYQMPERTKEIPMRKLALICFLLFITMSFGPKCLAQAPANDSHPAKAPQAPVHFYHLDFVIQEMGTDGKPTNSRSYTATVSTDASDHGTSIRTNSRIPVPTGSFSTGENAQSPVNTQFQYVDVGVNIDVHHAREMGRQLSLDLVAEVSSVAPTTDARIHQPVIRQNKWQASVLILIGKAVVVFTSDSLDSKGSLEVL